MKVYLLQAQDAHVEDPVIISSAVYKSERGAQIAQGYIVKELSRNGYTDIWSDEDYTAYDQEYNCQYLHRELDNSYIKVFILPIEIH